MHHHRRRKKRHIHGLRTVEVTRGKSGYGFTISGQQPCILSCIVSGSPADLAGLKTGDYLMGVNGLNISSAPHDDVVRMIGSSSGLLVLQIAENYNSSESSEEELTNRPKTKYPNRKLRQVQNRAVDDAFVPYGGGGGDRLVGHGAGVKHGGRKPYDHHRHRARSPGLDLERAEFDARQLHHHKLRGLENIHPHYVGAKSQRHKQPLPPPNGIVTNDCPPPPRTKHTIITREHRLGISSGRESRERLRAPVGAEAVPDGRMTPRELSNILYPSIQPHLANRHSRPESAENLAMLPLLGNSTKAVVGYVGSIEMPRDSRMPSSSLQSVRSAVRRLRVEKKIHTLVLMEVVTEGVRLVNQMGQEVAVYPAGKVAFSGSCPDDKRFFGIVTQHGLSMEEINVDNTIDESILGSSCHVFMVDPDLVSHSNHTTKARHFGLRCTQNPETRECLEFPPTPDVLLQCVAQLYEDRQAGLYTPNAAEGGALQRNSHRSDSTSSNGADSGLGFGREDPGADHVCVVDVPSGAAHQPSDMSGASGRWDSENSAFTALSSLSESQSHTGNDISFLSMESHERYQGLPPSDPLSSSASLSITASSHETSQTSQNMSLADRLNPRVGPIPAPRSGSAMTRHYSSSNLLDAQHSADNLRWNAHRIMQKHMEARPLGEHADHAFSTDLSEPRSDHNFSGSHDRPRPASVDMIRARSAESLTDRETTGDNQNQPKVEPRTFLAPGPLAATKRPKPPPFPTTASTAPKSDTSGSKPAPLSNPLLTGKPPLPERKPLSGRSGPRTPVNPPRTDLYRPKSTPPMRMRESSVVGLPLMEQDEGGSDMEDVSSILESFESWPWSNLPGEKPGDDLDQTDNRRHSDGHRLGKIIPSKGEGLKLTKASSFKQLKHSVLRSNLSNSHESLVASDSNGISTVKYEKLGGATSLATIGKGSLNNGPSSTNSVGRAAGWAVCFDKLLNDHAGVATFTEFLKKEFSEENILFWVKCEKYRNTSDHNERKAAAQDMFERHLASTAMEAVNVDSRARNLAQEGLDSAAADLFEEAQTQIYRLMRTDSYPRFLKSELYKQCVVAEMEGKRLPFGDDEVVQDKKLKKSKSSSSTEETGGDEKRRRSLLPWNRAKGEKGERRLSKMPTDPDLRQKINEATAANKDRPLSSCPKSSLDLADLSLISKEVQANNKENQGDGLEVVPQDATKGNQKFCRVMLPDGSTTVIYAGSGQSVRAALTKLCDRRKLGLSKLEVTYLGTDKTVDLSKDISSLGSKEIRLDKRALFQLDLSNRKSLVVKVKPERAIKDVLKPVLLRHGIKLEGMVLNLFGTGKPVDQEAEVSTIQGQRVAVQSAEDFSGKHKKKEWGGLGFSRNSSTKGSNHKSSHDNNQASNILKALLDGADTGGDMFDELGVWDPDKKHDDKTKSDTRGTGVFGFIRRNSVGEKEGNKLKTKARAMFGGSQRQPGPIKGVPPRSSRLDADEERFLELLSRAQSRTMDDQRGLTPADFELPEFLKVSQDVRNRESGGSADYGTKAKLRRTELHNSDSSIYESIMDESRLSRSFSKSQDKLTMRRQLSEDCTSMQSLRSFDTPQKIPYMDQSFDQEGLVPSHYDAEEYFSHSQVQGGSPDYNDSRLMDKSLRDIGLGHGLNTSKLSQRSDSSHDTRSTTPISLLPTRLSPRVKTPEVPPRLPPKPHPRVPKRQHQPGITDPDSLLSEQHAEATNLHSHNHTYENRALFNAPRPYSAPVSHPSFQTSQDPAKHSLPLHDHQEESDLECDIAHGLPLNISNGSRAESTPSPTTHDLVLESSPDTGDSPRIIPPKPAVRTSLLNTHSASNLTHLTTHTSIV